MSLWDQLRKQKGMGVSVALFALCLLVLLGTGLAQGVGGSRQAMAPDATPLVIPPAKEIGNEFSRLAKMVEPSVVYITTEYRPQVTQNNKRQPQRPNAEDQDEDGMEMFRRFFGENSPFGNGPQGPGGSQRGFRGEGAGSGFIVDKNGYIITNNHVVEDANSIKVKLFGDRTEYKAKVIGTDVETDLAIIKIDAGRPVVPLKIANSDGVQVGDWAVAIGAPFALEASVTAGIVSATGRDVAGAQQFQRFIQTDAAINPGNSGGPLLNINGEVIGVNTMIATRSGGNQGIGFALPINMAVKVYNGVISTGRVSRGSIGIQFQPNMRPEVLKALGAESGVIVTKVTPEGPADRAGLKARDVILSLNGKPVKDGDDLVNRIADLSSGTQVKLTVDRDGQRLDKNVTIEAREKVYKDDPRFSRMNPSMENPDDQGQSTGAKFGIGIRALSQSKREELSFNEPGGVEVTMVEDNSFAEEIGLRDRDVIVSINRKPVATFEDVKKIQASLKPGDAVAFEVRRPVMAGQRGSRVEWVSTFLGGTLPKE